MMNFLYFLFEEWYHFAGIFLFFAVAAGMVANFTQRVVRAICILFRGWPPEHYEWDAE